MYFIKGHKSCLQALFPHLSGAWDLPVQHLWPVHTQLLPVCTIISSCCSGRGGGAPSVSFLTDSCSICDDGQPKAADGIGFSVCLNMLLIFLPYLPHPHPALSCLQLGAVCYVCCHVGSCRASRRTAVSPRIKHWSLYAAFLQGLEDLQAGRVQQETAAGFQLHTSVGGFPREQAENHQIFREWRRPEHKSYLLVIAT